jgi:hypothetical protein
MPRSTTWRRVRVRNGGQIIEMVPAVADAMVEGGNAQYVNEQGVVTDFYGKPLRQVETASLNPGGERAMQSRPQTRSRGH